MRRSKKIILISLLAIVVLAGSIGGVVMAADNGDDSQPQTQHGALLDKVCEIYNTANPEAPIVCEELQKAFDEAQSQIREEARNQFRQRLIDEYGITEDQLNEYEAWLKSRPQLPTDEFKEWMESKPDVPLPFGPKNHGDVKPFGGFGRFGGGFHGFGGPCAPQE